MSILGSFLIVIAALLRGASTQTETPQSTSMPPTEPASPSSDAEDVHIQQDAAGSCHTCCRGLPGPPGVPGVPGSLGTYGMPGPRGKTGLPGEPGLRGERGFLGLSGETGEPGPVGPVGPPGLDGTQGLPGIAGSRGLSGSRGPRGFVGRPGMPGFYGQKGERGYPGMPSPQQQQVAFSVSLTNRFSGDRGQVILFDEVFTNIGESFSVLDGKFRCPAAGIYVFMYNIGLKEDHPKIGLMKNGERMATVYSTRDTNEHGQLSSGLILPLVYGDSVWLQFLDENGRQVYSDQSRVTNFSGFLLYEH